MHFPFKFAIVDLGTNSVRFDIYSLDGPKKVRRIHRERKMIRLGDGLYSHNMLSKGAIQRTVQAFLHIQQILELFQVSRVRILATSALRSARNRNDLLRRIRKIGPLHIEIISGAEEARLIAEGLLQSGSIPRGRFALIDIGGGSTEITFCRSKRRLKSYSLPLGALRLQQMFLRTSPPKPRRGCSDPIGSLRNHIAKMVKPLRYQARDTVTVLGSSGTIVSLEKVLRKNYAVVEPFGLQDLSHLVSVFEKMKEVEILSVPGVDYKRADIMLAGALLLEEIMRQLGFKRVFVSKFALRDGIYDEEILKIKKLLNLKTVPQLVNP